MCMVDLLFRDSFTASLISYFVGNNLGQGKEDLRCCTSIFIIKIKCRENEVEKVMSVEKMKYAPKM